MIDRARKILIVPSWYPSDEHPTAGIFIYQQVRALHDAGVDVAVLYVRESAAAAMRTVEVEDGVTTVRAELQMPTPSRKLCGRVRAVLTNLYNRFISYPREGVQAYRELELQWGTPDIIHVQALFPAAMIARRISRATGVPYVVTEHSEEYLAQSERKLVKYPWFVTGFLQPLAHGARRTVAVSRFLATRLEELDLAVDPVVIPNVVPVCDPTPYPDARPLRIAHVSVMGSAKDLSGLLRAVSLLRRKRSDFVLVLVGDGELRGDIELMVEDEGLSEVVEFAGRLDTSGVHQVLRDSAFTVVSSTHETFSVSAAESLMAGRPVVSTRCGGPEGFITPEVGLLVEVSNPEALADGMDWMLDNHARFDPEALHGYAVSMFSPDVVARRILELYEEAIDD